MEVLLDINTIRLGRQNDGRVMMLCDGYAMDWDTNEPGHQVHFRFEVIIHFFLTRYIYP